MQKSTVSEPPHRPMQQWHATGSEPLPELADRPVVLRGLAEAWPLVRAAADGDAAVLAMLRPFVTATPLKVMLGAPEIRGRFFYADDMRGFNFKLETVTLPTVLDLLQAAVTLDDPPAIYAGASAIGTYAPAFLAQHALPLSVVDATPRIWIGNATQVATHYDLSENIAVVAAGRRRFTLFPPEATPDLYVGPLGFTIAGQPVSMVDPLNPDLARFPRYPAAREHAMTADLAPGDAIFIPTFWWHHVQSFGRVNVLVNYWNESASAGQPFNALLHAMLGIRDLPDAQRAAWRVWFDHFVFGDEAKSAADHIPDHARGVQAASSPERTDAIRHYLASRLGAG